MDQITKKPEKKPETDKKEDKKDGGKPGPSQEELRRARMEEEEQRAKEKAEREQERLRHQELRHAEVVNNRLTENRDVDLVSDEWGQPKPTIPGKMASLSIAKPNLKPPILAPSVDDYDEPAQDDYLDNNDDDDDDDDFDLPAPVAALPSAEDELKVSQKIAQAQPEPLQEEIEDNFDDYGGGGDDAPDNYSDDDLDNMDQTQSKTQYETLNSKERLVKDKNEIRSRTPSPFLSTNRYYPEFYAKKAEEERAEKEKAKQTKLSKSSPKNDSNDSAENEKEDTASKHTSVKQQQSEESNKRDSRIDNIKFSTDIDERIARYFRERRSKKEKKHKKSIIKDFEIDPNSSFLDAAANKSENAISRLTGDGLGLFINKVITSLSKSKSSSDPSSVPKPCPPPAQSSESPSKIPLPVAVPQPVPPPQPFTGLTPQPVPHPSAPRLGILPAPPPPPLPPPPPPPIEEGEKLPVELEPGELPDSPHHSLLSQSAEGTEDFSLLYFLNK